MILRCPICLATYDTAHRYDNRNVELWLICPAGHEYGVRLKNATSTPTEEASE